MSTKNKNSLPWIFATVAALIIGFFIGKSMVGKSSSEQEDIAVYATYQGGQVTAKEVLEKIGRDLEQNQQFIYDLKKRTTEEIIRSRLQTDNKPPEYEKEVISDSELVQFLKERNMDAKKLKKQDMTNILNNMKLQKALQSKKQQTDSQLANLNIVWSIPLPKVREVNVGNGSGPRLGPAMASMTLVFFGNYHCPFCSVAGKRLEELKEKHKDKIKIYMRFSMREPDNSLVRAAAEATFCAGDQNKFWEFYDQMIKTPPQDFAAFARTADTLKLNIESFTKCLTERKHKSEVEKDIADASKNNLLEVPIFVIDGRVLPAQGPLP